MPRRARSQLPLPPKLDHNRRLIHRYMQHLEAQIIFHENTVKQLHQDILERLRQGNVNGAMEKYRALDNVRTRKQAMDQKLSGCQAIIMRFHQTNPETVDLEKKVAAICRDINDNHDEMTEQFRENMDELAELTGNIELETRELEEHPRMSEDMLSDKFKQEYAFAMALKYDAPAPTEAAATPTGSRAQGQHLAVPSGP